MSHSHRTALNELASAAIFVLVGFCGVLIWLGSYGFVPGYALFGLGWIIALEVEDRFRFGRAHKLTK